MLEARGVWFAYRRGHWVLRGVDFELRPGSIVAVVGPNGSGKTTLLRILGLLERPQRGSVLVDGFECSRGCPAAVRRRVVYVHPEPIVAPGSVVENVALGLMLRGVGRREAEERARRLLEGVGAGDLAERDARSLSMGQRQLVSVLRAVAVEPRYLLLDEPTAYLDEDKRLAVVDILRRLASRGVGIAVATHDRMLAAELGASVYRMGAQAGRTFSPPAGEPPR